MGRAYLGVESRGDDIESEAEWCQEALGMVLDTTAKKIRICAQSKGWLNGEIKERRSYLGREERRRRRRWVGTAQAMAELQKSFRTVKESMWNDYLKNLREAGVWGAEMIASPRAGATVDVPMDRHGRQANIIIQREEGLRREFFPSNEHNQYFELSLARHMHQSVSEQVVEQPLFMQSVGNAPGADKLSFGAIHLVWE
jgi:hypothetical protein